MKNSHNKISVLMAVKNGEKYLQAAIDSVISQTYSAWEFIIINDGSTDQTANILRTNKDKDDRFIIIENKTSLGLAKSLNLGLSLASGVYLARADADDISHPNRFQVQSAHLDQNIDTILVGSNAILIDDTNNFQGITDLPISSDQIKSCMLLKNPICHPSAMIRLNSLKDNQIIYDENFVTSQDWDLWSRLIDHGDFYNIKEHLVYYRIHQNSTSAKNKQRQLSNSLKVQKSIYEKSIKSAPFPDTKFWAMNKYFFNSSSLAKPAGCSISGIVSDVFDTLSKLQNNMTVQEFRAAKNLVISQALSHTNLRRPLKLNYTLVWYLIRNHRWQVLVHIILLLSRKHRELRARRSHKFFVSSDFK